MRAFLGTIQCCLMYRYSLCDGQIDIYEDPVHDVEGDYTPFVSCPTCGAVFSRERLRDQFKAAYVTDWTGLGRRVKRRD